MISPNYNPFWPANVIAHTSKVLTAPLLSPAKVADFYLLLFFSFFFKNLGWYVINFFSGVETDA